MGKLALFFETSAGKRVKNMIIGVGAAVVLMGALFKLMHWPGASMMLIIGMSVEAFIFLLQGILPPHEDYYWEKLYPGLNVSPEVEEHTGGGHGHKAAIAAGGKKGSITEELDDMLEKAKIEQSLLDRLGANMAKLGDNIEKMGEVADAAGATSEYSNNAKEAAGALAAMKSAYTDATDSVRELAQAGSGTKEYHDQVTQISKNLAALNSMYELELQDTNNHLKAMNSFYGSLVNAMNNLDSATEDTMKYKQEMASLSKNLGSLNSIYGNMLNAMANPMGNAGNSNNG